jgi:histidyl-tRNA synthetase
LNSKVKIQGVRGMNDVLPVDASLWESFESTVASALRAYGYERIRTPIVEATSLFVRGIGEVTDIVEKEMYSFVDGLNGESLTLRPENTAAVVRSVIEHNLTYERPQRLWYSGPMFRHERPQKGRYRQFHQVGAEAIGFAGPDVDAELILLCQRLWDDLGLPPMRLEINCLGQADERLAHRAALITYFEANVAQLDADALRRLHSNPLRILDTKNPTMQALVEGAPQLIEFLGEASKAHFNGLQRLLKSQNLPFKINPRLVRGLDYYNLTVFEWMAPAGDSWLTVCGGGRYDPLIEMVGGKATPACGFALGVERVLELMRSKTPAEPEPLCDVYVIHQGEAAQIAAFTAAEQMRSSGLDVVVHAGSGNFKAQFKRADQFGAQFAVIIGEDEVAKGEVALKNLDEQSQITVPMDQLVAALVDAMTDDSAQGTGDKNMSDENDKTIH